MCRQTQSIEHLLFSFCYVKPLVQVVNIVYGISVKFKQTLGLVEMSGFTTITTFISFFIYKEGLLLSLKGKKWTPVIALSKF